MSKKLLIVEDEADFIFVLTPYAKKNGYHLEIDPTGADCLNKALQMRPDAILLDMNLPQITGFCLIQMLKNHPELSLTPIIVLSSINDNDVIEEALDRGASAYFTKDKNLNDLFDIIKEYIDYSSRTTAESSEYETGVWEEAPLCYTES